MALKQGEEENRTHRRCTQTQCGYFVAGNCRACDDCGATPYELKKSCKRCLDCEGVPGELRWDEGKGGKMTEKQMLRHLQEACRQRLEEIDEEKEPEPEREREMVIMR